MKPNLPPGKPIGHAAPTTHGLPTSHTMVTYGLGCHRFGSLPGSISGSGFLPLASLCLKCPLAHTLGSRGKKLKMNESALGLASSKNSLSWVKKEGKSFSSQIYIFKKISGRFWFGVEGHGNRAEWLRSWL